MEEFNKGTGGETNKAGNGGDYIRPALFQGYGTKVDKRLLREWVDRILF